MERGGHQRFHYMSVFASERVNMLQFGFTVICSRPLNLLPDHKVKAVVPTALQKGLLNIC